ncbi:MAG: Hpt domain-containing protein [Chloroflexi bacterium]|nr:Hpt domain-containing protein [Chloroflexota bacterium]
MTEQVVDRAVFENLKAMMGEDFIGELIDVYFEDTPLLIAEMRKALSIQDTEVFRRAAHSVKSNSANFGAMQLSMLARELEMMGKDGKIEAAVPKLERLEVEFQKVQLVLKDLENGH